MGCWTESGCLCSDIKEFKTTLHRLMRLIPCVLHVRGMAVLCLEPRSIDYRVVFPPILAEASLTCPPEKQKPRGFAIFAVPNMEKVNKATFFLPLSKINDKFFCKTIHKKQCGLKMGCVAVK